MSDDFTREEGAVLTPYVTNVDKPIYALRNLPEEVVAVLFAYYSRSRESLRRNLLKLIQERDIDLDARMASFTLDEAKLTETKEKARQFHEKWVVGYGHACYDEATEVLTDQGWLTWREVAEAWHQDRQHGSLQLATLNPETGFLEYLVPLCIIAEPYSGSMYRVCVKAVDLCVTPNHRMWVCPTRTWIGRRQRSYRLIPAAELKGVPCVYQLSAKWQGPEPETLLVGGRQVNAEALIRLTGFFIGDGYGDRRYHSAVTFNLRKQREIAFLHRAVEDCGFEWRLHGAKYYVIGPGIGNFLNQCYDNRRRKVIPAPLLQHGPRILKSLLDGLLHSDGGIDKGNLAIYDTSSETLKDQLYELALKVGWAAYSVTHLDKRPGHEGARLMHRVHLNRTRLKPAVNKGSDPKQDWWEEYKGFIYCAEMPRNHILYVRRNGRPVWSGNSVAEHAVVHLAVEDVSIIASKLIEDTRLASYTEKSTRYVLFDEQKFYRVPRLMQSAHAALYEDTVRSLLRTYVTLLPKVVECIKTRVPRRDTQSERAYETACRAKAYDLLRYLLPASTLTNLGLTINARALEHLLTKLLSHPLEEARDIAVAMKREAEKVVPTLLKYAAYSSYIAETDQAMRQLGRELSAGEDFLETPAVNLVRFPLDAEEQLAAAILYGYAHAPWAQVVKHIGMLSAESRELIIDDYLQRRGPHDQPLRALEHLYFTFDIVLDYGAYRDIQRHRMATQTRQDFSTRYGYSVPDDIVAYGLGEVFHEGMARAAEAYGRIAEDYPLEAQYVLPLAYRVRVLFTWNLRELFHFIQLRSAKQGHSSYRQIAQQVYREIERVHPALARYIRVDLSDYQLGRL
jgi:thymidylate synthase ThyX